jgi:hypothetical protein
VKRRTSDTEVADAPLVVTAPRNVIGDVHAIAAGRASPGAPTRFAGNEERLRSALVNDRRRRTAVCGKRRATSHRPNERAIEGPSNLLCHRQLRLRNARDHRHVIAQRCPAEGVPSLCYANGFDLTAGLCCSMSTQLSEVLIERLSRTGPVDVRELRVVRCEE